ncbi:MAG: hypothetical protein K2F89_06555 [Treponemataceae bacterium]|nr:hypothetical protein [Treponemataceae bacterium]
MSRTQKDKGDAWYNASAENDDVIVSSRVRLARNLANFPFPENFDEECALQVQNIIFDSFNHFDDADAYQTMILSTVPKLGADILRERGLVEENFGTGLVMRVDGVSSCLLNCSDHVRISSFAPGLACSTAYTFSHNIDMQLQEKVQFAASHEFGYLTSSICESGSGMKLSLRVHLPSISFAGKISELAKVCDERGFSVRDSFGSGTQFGSSLGGFYQISSRQSVSGNEIDQLAGITSLGKYICEFERKIRGEVADNKFTEVRDMILRAFAQMRYSLLMPLRESIDLISAIKWGVDLGLICGVEDYELSSLLYKVQSGHLGFLLRTSEFNFDDDIASDDALKEKRLRSIVMQEALKKMTFVEKLK